MYRDTERFIIQIIKIFLYIHISTRTQYVRVRSVRVRRRRRRAPVDDLEAAVRGLELPAHLHRGLVDVEGLQAARRGQPGQDQARVPAAACGRRSFFRSCLP